MTDMRIRLGRPGITDIKILVGSRSNAAISVSASGGTVAIGTIVERVAPSGGADGLYTCVVTISGLSGITAYSATITQGAISRQANWTTLPADQVTPFSFFFTGCDKFYLQNPAGGAWHTLKDITAQYANTNYPALFFLHPDDVAYVDQVSVNDALDSQLATSGNPENTGLVKDYHIAWASVMGLLGSSMKHRDSAHQWRDQNMPAAKSGGDHAIALNYARGRVGAGDYFGNDPVLGATAKVAWDAWYGDVNPDPLDADMVYWGLEAGPLRFVLMDSSYHSDPYNNSPDNSNDAKETHPHYGQTQIASMFNYLDTDAVPFKFMLMETCVQNGGQPWADWWIQEAAAWKADLDSRDNLNGTVGNFAIATGDYHTLTVDEYDTFWSFTAALMDSQCVSNNASGWKWGGKRHFFLGMGGGDTLTGQRMITAFNHVLVHAHETPRRLTIRGIDGNNGAELYSYDLIEGAANNQWVPTPRTTKMAY